PFAWTTPDGYPDTAPEWSGSLLHRWNFALDVLVNRISGVEVDVWDLAERGHADKNSLEMLRFFGRLLLYHDLSPSDEQTLGQFLPADPQKDKARMIEALGLLAASPAFQWR
ncbi:MAG: DUF1800 family protein, partial [Anaerolineae bacterium]|nr:DUF1800 family protein [Anaerolineae bacterium]